MSVSDSRGQTTGGHVLDNNLIYTTLEIVVADLTDMNLIVKKIQPTVTLNWWSVPGPKN
ncbi:MAG: hypothetical protein WDN75_10845 [Bacteroidota bacterium]